GTSFSRLERTTISPLQKGTGQVIDFYPSLRLNPTSLHQYQADGFFLDANGDGYMDYIYLGQTGTDHWFFSAPRIMETSKPDVLQTIIFPSRAQISFSYGNAASFDLSSHGHLYPVVTGETLTGPNIEPSTMTFAYSGLLNTQSWHDPAKMTSL